MGQCASSSCAVVSRVDEQQKVTTKHQRFDRTTGENGSAGIGVTRRRTVAPGSNSLGIFRHSIDLSGGKRRKKTLQSKNLRDNSSEPSIHDMVKRYNDFEQKEQLENGPEQPADNKRNSTGDRGGSDGQSHLLYSRKMKNANSNSKSKRKKESRSSKHKQLSSLLLHPVPSSLCHRSQSNNNYLTKLFYRESSEPPPAFDDSRARTHNTPVTNIYAVRYIYETTSKTKSYTDGCDYSLQESERGRENELDKQNTFISQDQMVPKINEERLPRNTASEVDDDGGLAVPDLLRSNDFEISSSSAFSNPWSEIHCNRNLDLFTSKYMNRYIRQQMLLSSSRQFFDNIKGLTTISEEHNIYVCDLQMTKEECDKIIYVTEQCCKGNYAAYTYAKQTLGCREYKKLSEVCYKSVLDVYKSILYNLHYCEIATATTTSGRKNNRPKSSYCDKQMNSLVLDDREPHMVKYDVTKKEKAKLDMHTDKSEWTFLISLSDGVNIDYDGGGTYFEVINSTVHVQRGYALIFPGKLRHCGSRITSGLRFLLVGFLVDKSFETTTQDESCDPQQQRQQSITRKQKQSL